MSCSTFFGELFERMYATADVADSAAVARARTRLPGVPFSVIADKHGIPEEHRSRSTLFMTAPRGNPVGKCPGTRGHPCCNYITIDLYMGCTLGCSYCIMKYYLNFSPITVYTDTEPGIEAVRALSRLNPGRAVRVGTGEVGDSLLLDPLFELSAEYIDAFAELPNVTLELKTKTDRVDHLLALPRKGNAVIGFSVNPPGVVAAEDGTSAPLERRIAAALRATESGYRVAFHFDPIFLIPDLEDAYLSVIRELERVPAGKIAWISLGTFRYPPQLKEKIDDRPYLYEEFVPCRDGKFRYLQRVRSRIYRLLARELSDRIGAPVYLCMESDDVWRNVFGKTPAKIEILRDIFSPVEGVCEHVHG
jgi:spore photoproduct lyase